MRKIVLPKKYIWLFIEISNGKKLLFCDSSGIRVDESPFGKGGESIHRKAKDPFIKERLYHNF
ncbi:MAG: hypothetical protein A2Y81_10980 [Nitrospirae bacterium RBG_13_43_8]|nr:MAG: hypothetical protein A2Y81_10980 [Nitrospirae bacterium RBG_13_43_8]